MKQLTYEQALQRMAGYCSCAERCISELRRKMNAWEIPETEQDKIVRRLLQEKFVDESRYCRAFVNDKTRHNRWGIQKIRYELRKKQLPEDLIAEALEAIDPDEGLERLRELLQNKRKTVRGKSEYEIKQKLMRFAAGRGFSLDDIEKALS